MQSDFFDGLNPPQKKAVETTEGPLLILAGAGSGKTKTLTHRTAYIIGTGKALPNNILAVTFTNKAAAEMRRRVAELTGNNPLNRSFMPFMGTFHGVCVRLLRQDGEYCGIPRNFVIWDESDRAAAIKQASRLANINEKTFTPRLLGSLISNAKNEMIGPSEFLEISGVSPATKAAAKVFPLYEKMLSESKALDFDDLIGRSVSMLKSQKEIRQKWQTQFKYIMIDEYQDTNAAQYELIRLLTGPHRNIAVVGDDWQSIYSWRGADFRNILNFETDYPGCTVIKLEQNYRSTKPILDAAHRVISANTKRSNKKLWTSATGGQPVQVLQTASERHEGENIVRIIGTAVDSGQYRLRDFAVLYRTNAQSRALEEAFLRHAITYRVVGGVRFYDRKEVKDILAYLRLIYQPDDLASMERIVNVPTRGIGQRSQEIFGAWRAKNGYSLRKALLNASECSDLTPRAREGFSELGQLVKSFSSFSESMAPANLIEKLTKRLNYFEYLKDGTPQGEARIENVKELLGVAGEYHDLGLAGFLEEAALISDADKVEQGADAVSLMTLHTAKGLEFAIVFITGLEETVLPHSRALYDAGEMEEERRLMYVGMTRAKQRLYLLYSIERSLYGGRSSNPPSRFLADIDAQVSASTESTVSLAHSQARQEPRLVLDLAEGDGVSHKIFGKGTVLEVVGETATVYFKGKGTKKLNISFAPLEKLEF